MQVNQVAIRRLHEEAERASKQPTVTTRGRKESTAFSIAFEKALQEYYYDRPRCPECDHAEPPMGGPYCKCKAGQDWQSLHRRWVEEDRQAVEEARRRRLEREFGPMMVPPQFQGITPWTMVEQYGESAKKGKVNAIKAAAAWAGVDLTTGKVGEPTAQKWGLLLYGDPGTGKSALAWWAVQARGWGLWLTWNDLLGQIQNEWEGREALIEAAQNAPVLFLDDLGDPYSSNGRITDDRRNILFRIINHRLANQLPTIITSNINGGNLNVVMVNLERQFDERIVDRLFELCNLVEMGGANLRRAPKKGAVG